MLKGIIFDFDYTLTDRSVALYQGAKHIVEDVCPQLDAMHQEAIIQRIITLDEFGTIDRQHIMDNLVKHYSLDIKQLQPYFKELSNYMAPFTVLDHDAIKLLEYLKKHTNYKLAILTNGNSATQLKKIKQTKIEKYFDYIAVSEESGYWKPDKRAFQYIANKLALRCEDCLYIGDVFFSDIIGAYDAGMQYLLLNNDRKRTFSKDVPIIEHLIDLISYLEI